MQCRIYGVQGMHAPLSSFLLARLESAYFFVFMQFSAKVMRPPWNPGSATGMLLFHFSGVKKESFIPPYKDIRLTQEGHTVTGDGCGLWMLKVKDEFVGCCLLRGATCYTWFIHGTWAEYIIITHTPTIPYPPHIHQQYHTHHSYTTKTHHTYTNNTICITYTNNIQWPI